MQMNIPQDLRRRINFQGEFEELLKDVADSYKIGNVISFEPKLLGIEDLNLKLTTTKGSYFIKIFNEKRDNAECLRLINIVKMSLDNGVSHPEFLKRDVGYIFRNQYEQFNIRLAVFEYIEGKTFYELKRNATSQELKEIIKNAAMINMIEYKPAEIYDNWAIVNFPAEYKKARKHLPEDQQKIFEGLLTEYEKVKIKSLPHSLVHGDLKSTNIIKGKEKIYVVDLSAANYYPRIVELAILMSDVMFDPTDKITVKKYYSTLITEYQTHIKLNQDELEVLPLFIKLAHGMNYLGATIEKETKKNKSEENEYRIQIGKKGLAMSSKAFS